MTRSTRWRTRAATTLATAGLAAAGVVLAPGAAQAATTYGHAGAGYGTTVTHPPTSDKPQSKLWWNAGSWWADMWISGKGWHITRLDRSTETWVDTGVAVDSRASSLPDTLWDGSHLYIASQVSTVSTNESPVASQSGQPAKLYRYSYSGGTYSLDAGFPTTINNSSSETLTIDEDSTGALWSTWTQVSGSSSSGYTSTVYVNSSAAGGTGWGTPTVIPAADPNPSADDISAVVAFGGNRIGVMWTDEDSDTVHWDVHTDGTSRTSSSSWKEVVVASGNHVADDHLNLKTLQADANGKVYAAAKTSYDLNGGSSSQAQLLLYVYNPATGAFTKSTISTLADCETRPQVVLDTQNNLVHVFTTGPSTSVSGCPYAGTAGSIYEKTASMSNPVFGSGRGTPVIQDGSSPNVNNVTTSKQSVSSTTGLVVLASNSSTHKYWFADESLGGTPAPTAPTAGFTVSPTSGTAPLTVAFTDTSTGSPTSWSWDFGDGSAAATTQNPSHTYTAAGTYTVTLTATNAAGSTTATKTGAVTVGTTPTPTPTPTGTIAVRSSAKATSTAATTAVSLDAPSGLATGDVLVAQINADGAPALSSVPSGWSPVVTATLSPNSASKTFVYYHVVTDASSEPGSFAFGLSAAEKWGAGVTAYSGVSTTSPFDTAAVTKVNTSASSTVSLAGVTTATNGALLIGGVGVNSTGTTVSAPSGWTESWEADGGQDTSLASRTQGTAGATGAVSFPLSASSTAAGWMRALRPAS